MRYFTWKLDWSSGEGIDPTATVNSDIVRVEPNFATGSLQDSSTVVYSYLLKGELNPAELSRWCVEETTLENMFTAAQLLSANSFIENGFVRFLMLDDGKIGVQ